MKFQVSKNKILQAVNIVKQAVANRTTNPILKTILIEAGEDGWLTLRATNNTLDISAMIEADIQEAGRVCVSDLVIDLLPTFEDGQYKDNVLTNPVKFELTEKSLIVTQGKRKHRPVFMSPDDFPKKLEVTDYQEVKDAAQLIEAFQRLNVAVGVTEDRRILQGFHLNPHLNMMVTGDGTRAYLRENITLPGNIANPQAKLVMSVLSNLTGLTDKDKLEVKSGGMVAFKATQFTNDNPYLKWEIIITGLDGEFPTTPRKLIQDNLANTPKLTIKTDKQVLSKILGICKVYSDRAFDEGKSTHLTMTKNGSGIMFSMHIPDLVEMEEPLECQYEGDDFIYRFHPGLALEALNTMKTDAVELRFFGELTPFLILDGSEFTYLQGAMKQSSKGQVTVPKTEGEGLVDKEEK